MPDERVAIVFGGASGIGRASAEALASQGCRVMVADLNGDAGAATASIIEAGGGIASHVSTDITDEDSVRSAIGATVDQFGTLGVLVTSVGASPGKTGAEGWIRAIDLFLKGPFYASLHGIPELERNGGGAIVHIGSIASIRGSITRRVEQSGYPTAKHGLLGLTRTLALAYGARGIRVNAVCPGYIKTQMTRSLHESPESDALIRDTLRVPLGRWGEPHEIGKVVAFLASDDASYLTGQAIVVDGGMTAR